MEDFQAMRAFGRVAELGSFTRAADELGLSRAMVTTHVQRLEKRFGLRLLNRTTRKVALTPAGAEYLGHCRRIFAELNAAEEMLRRTQEQPTGRLCVDVPGSFGRHILLPALPDFLERYPGIDLDLRFNERVVDIARDGVDLAVRAGTVTDPDVVAHRISGSRWITCASPVYLARHGRPQRLEDLVDHVLIGSIPPGGSHPRPWLFADDAVSSLEFRFRMTVNESETVMLAAARGVGITQTMDLLAARELVDGNLVTVLTELTCPGPPLSIVHTPAAQRLARVRVFAQFLRGLCEYVVQRAAAHTGLRPIP
ncbi:MAG: LysR family transcriptional regulator [Steroidobacteraceae bacterium]